MGPEGGWKRRRLAAVPGSCHCSEEQNPARRDKGEEAAAVGSWPRGAAHWQAQTLPDSFAAGKCGRTRHCAPPCPSFPCPSSLVP